jgi:hypothetical protein
VHFLHGGQVNRGEIRRSTTAKDAGSSDKQYGLRGNLRQNVHALNLGGDAEVRAGSLFHPQDAGVAANPAFLSGGQFWGEDENQLNVRAFDHAGVGIKENAIGAHVAGLSAQFGIRGSVTNTHRQFGDDSFARAAVEVRSH